VLLHELAHVRRRDWITLLVAEIAAAVYWFHPLVWLARREARRSCERACDDLVLDAGTKPSVYAAHLLGIVRSLKPARAAALPVMAMARPSQFEGRMRAILDPGLHRRGPSRAATRGAALGALFAVVSLGAVHPWVERACAAACPPESTASKPRAWAGSTASAASAASAEKTKDVKKPCVSKPSRETEAVQPEVSAPAPAPAPAAAPAGFVLASNARQRTGEEWYAKAMELHNDERYDEAIAAFQKSIDLGYREATAAYNIACGYARKNDVSSAFTWLEKAKDLGFPVAEYLEGDDDLEALHKDARFVAMRKEARAKKADEHPEEGKRAAKAFERLESRGAQDGSALFQNGRDLLAAGEYSLAAKAFHRSAEVGYRAGASFYNEACSLSLGGETAPALDALRRSIENGYDDPDHMRKDDDLDGVRSAPRYREIETLADDLQMPSIGWGSEFLRSTRRTEWREAAAHAEKMTARYPRLGRSWFNLGFAQLRADRAEAAAESFQKALELGYRKPTTTYNVACSYARLGRKDVAFEWLFRALDAGFDSDGTIRGDDDLDNLRGDPRYRKALDRARAKSHNQD
jgi:tetratricopeptide (TPR) repeat protein